MGHKDKKPIKFVERQDPDHPYCTNWPMSEEENNIDTIKDFIGIFPNVVSKEYCEKIIEHFNWIQKTREPVFRSDSSLDMSISFLGAELDFTVMEIFDVLVLEFSKATEKCYLKLKEKYNFLEEVKSHQMSPSIKIQKYKPSQGFHVWHCDADAMHNSRRMMTSILYLNTVKEGGETEFLHQSTRISPVQGTLALFPTYWTHPHRGNPPLEGDKYIMSTWLEFMEM